MFYEKLAEAKQEKKREGLSGLQMGGVGLAGAAGATAPALGAVYGKPTSTFNKILSNNKYETQMDKLRDESILAKAKFEAQDAPMQESLNKYREMRDKTKSTLRKGRREPSQVTKQGKPYFLIKEGLDALENQLPKMQNLVDLQQKDIDNLYQAHVRARNQTSTLMDELRGKSHTSKRNKLLGTMGLAGVGTAFAAKKLFDRYNKRKQQSSQ